MHQLKFLLAASLLFLTSAVFSQDLGQADPGVAAALDEQGVIYSINDEGNFVVEYQMDADEERSQRVFVVSRASTYRNAELREIWSVAVVLSDYPDKELMYYLLTVNSGIKVGAWAVEEFDDELWILYTIKVPVDLGSAALKDLIYFTAEMCDELEVELVGDDIY
ncbi:MAG: hypothetical protein ABIJ86_13395 [Spirochaetota bacterium]